MSAQPRPVVTKLEVYQITFHRKYHPDQGVRIGDIFPPIFPHIANYCRDCERQAQYNEGLAKSVQMGSLTINDNVIFGQVGVGSSDRENDVLDTASSTIVFRVERHHALVAPMYFYLEFPEDSFTGLLLCSRYGRSGFKTVFEYALKDIVKNKYEDYAMTIELFQSIKVIEQVLKERTQFQCIRILNPKFSSDRADQLRRLIGETEPIDEHYDIEIQLRPRNKLRRLPLIERLRNTDDYAIALTDNADNEEVLVRVTIPGTTKTFNVAKPGQASTTFDISEKVELGPDRYPTMLSVHAAASDLAKFARDAIITQETGRRPEDAE